MEEGEQAHAGNHLGVSEGRERSSEVLVQTSLVLVAAKGMGANLVQG